MNITEVVTILIDTMPIWATSLVAIIGCVVTVIKGLHKVKDAVDEMKADKTLKEINEKCSNVMQENEMLIKQLNIMVDRVKQIEGYMEAINEKQKD